MKAADCSSPTGRMQSSKRGHIYIYIATVVAIGVVCVSWLHRLRGGNLSTPGSVAMGRVIRKSKCVCMGGGLPLVVALVRQLATVYPPAAFLMAARQAE